MLFIFISKFHSYCYLSAAFQSNIDCFSADPLVSGITCTDLAAQTRFSASLTAIITALAASMATCEIAQACSIQLPFMNLPYVMHINLPYV